MMNQTIAFIGGGNMATSLVAGLIADGYKPSALVVSEPDSAKRAALAERFDVGTTSDNAAALSGAAVAVLCVKPQMAREVCQGLASATAAGDVLFISIMAGIREASLQAWLGGGVPVVRSMPNTPAMIQAGAIVLHATEQVSPEQRNLAETILRAGGLTRWVEREELLDVVTALSGSGPAYFFLLMEAMEAAGIRLGLDPESARLLTLQTALGAARMAIESEESPEILRQRVTSPGGTTERALGVLEDGGLRPLVDTAIAAARDRSEELSRLLAEAP
jgi:pyrroline-5-carboxylate reductase